MPSHSREPRIAGNAITSISCSSTSVYVTFARPYVKGDDKEGDLTPLAETVLGRIADATGSCQWRRINKSTVELLGQAQNDRVNTLEAVRQTICAAPRMAETPLVSDRKLTAASWALWRGQPEQEERILSLRGLPEATPVLVDLTLTATTGSLKRREVEAMRVALQGTQYTLLTPNGPRTPVLRYYTTQRDDTGLANEIGELIELLGKVL